MRQKVKQSLDWPQLGKTDLTQFMPISDAESLIAETEVIFNRFGMDAPVCATDMDQARTITTRFGIDLLLIKQKHLGSDRLPGYIATMTDHINS